MTKCVHGADILLQLLFTAMLINKHCSCTVNSRPLFLVSEQGSTDDEGQENEEEGQKQKKIKRPLDSNEDQDDGPKKKKKHRRKVLLTYRHYFKLPFCVFFQSSQCFDSLTSALLCIFFAQLFDQFRILASFE